jgi:phosphoserine aminotransferase
MDVIPPVFNIYVAKLVLQWIKSVGGLEEMKRRNEKKASLLYDFIDGQFYYISTIDKKCRSMTNIVFNTGSSALDERFCIEASVAGFTNLNGHESIGGICASIYNSMPYEAVEKLVDFMKDFAKNNSKFNE